MYFSAAGRLDSAMAGASLDLMREIPGIGPMHSFNPFYSDHFIH